MQPQNQQGSSQPVETKRSNVDKIDKDRLMPGLVTPIADTFNRPRANFNVRGVGRRKKVPEMIVTSALLRDLYSQVGELREMVARRGVQSETGPFVVSRRSA